MIVSHHPRADVLRYSRIAPAWIWGRLSQAARSLPNFIIIGTQRGGTTSLYHYLSGHSQVLPALKKEVHYFDLNYGKGLGWYRAHFPPLAELDRLRRTTGISHLTGEASPYYLFHPLVPDRIKAALPDARLLVLLRNPVDRAYSHYQHERRQKRERLSFADAIAIEERRLRGGPQPNGLDQRYRSRPWRRFSYLARGRYVDQLRRWLEVFPREQFLILKSEDLFEDPAEAIARVTTFLGLARASVTHYVTHNASRAPQDSGIARPVRVRLERYFAPLNAELSDLLGDSFHWRVD